jgi:hypothetical protein
MQAAKSKNWKPTPVYRRSWQEWILFSVATLISLSVPWMCSLAATAVVLTTGPYFALYPGISTQYARDFTDIGFRQIQIGDTQERVLELIGEPLWGCEKANADYPCSGTVWTYSYQSETFPIFAWLHNEVRFDAEGRVETLWTDVVYGGDW